MGVFDSTPKTPTAAVSWATDKQTPPSRDLNYAAIASTSALSGTSGVDVALITGNSDYQFLGNLLEHVSANRNLQIDGHLKKSVAGNAVNTVAGTTSDTHIGNHQQVNVAPRTDIFNHTRTEIHAQPEHVKQPTERNESTSSESKESQKIFEKKSIAIELVELFSMDMNPALSLELNNRDMGITNVGFDATFHDVETKAFKSDVAAFKSDVKGLKVKAALTHAKAIGADLNAGLALNSDSPMA